MDNPQIAKLVRALEQIGNGLNYIGKSIEKLSINDATHKGSITLLAKSIEHAGIDIAHSINNLDTKKYKFEQEYPQIEYINNPQEIKSGDIIYHNYYDKLFSYQPESNNKTNILPVRLLQVKDVDGKLMWIDVKLCRKATEQEIEWFQIETKEKTKQEA